VAGTAFTYNIKGSATPGYTVTNGDKIFFAETNCNTVPGSNAAAETAPILLKEYDSLSASTSYQAARVTIPTTLTTNTGGATRNLVACYATAESAGAANTYALLQDGLQMITAPRARGTRDVSPGPMRGVEKSTSEFSFDSLALGDLIYFKKLVLGDGTDCTISQNQPNGLILPNLPTVSSGTETVALPAKDFVGTNGKASLAGSLATTAGAYGVKMPTVFTTCFIPAGAIPNLHAGSGANGCPLTPAYVAIGGGSNANAGVCTLDGSNKATMLNAVRLTDQLTVFAEPTDALVNSWFQGYVFELKFTQPQFGVYGTPTFASGFANDIVVLQKDNCNGVHEIQMSTYVLGGSRSAKMVLEEFGGEMQGDEKGGAAMVKSIAQGKVNELPTGIYQICYATAESVGDDQDDYTALGKTFEILPPTATKPSMSVPRSVLMGGDIVVSWESTVQLQTKIQSQNSWIGLYKKGSCMGNYGKTGNEWTHSDNEDIRNAIINTQMHPDDPKPIGSYYESNQHECYLASQFIESGVSSGVVRFAQVDYKTGDVFNVRFFQGDSRNKQGRICRGLTGVSFDTSVECVLEPALVSGDIEVFVDSAKVDNLASNSPGYEVMFNDQRARFQKGSRANRLA